MTQSTQILAHLKSGRSITPIGALAKWGCYRLAARIYDLRQSGHVINRVLIETSSGARCARYRLISEAK